jgi:hypothetical protein
LPGPENITTWIGVAASAVSGVATVVTVFLRSRTKEKLAAIDKGTPEAAQIVANAIASFQLNTGNLTKEQTFVLARDEIASRDKRHARVFYISLALAIVLLLTTVALATLWHRLFPKSETTFALVVRVSGPKGPSDVIRIGKITLDIGQDRRTQDIGSNGEASFQEIPMRNATMSIPIIASVPGYHMADVSPRSVPDSHVIYVTLVADEVGDAILTGRVVGTLDRGLAAVRLSVTGGVAFALTDGNGNFSLRLPGAADSKPIRVRAEKDGLVGFDDYLTAPGPVTITFRPKG